VRPGFIDRFAGLDSPLHLIEARSKLAGFAALMVSVLIIPAHRSFLFFLYFFAVAILMGISQIPLAYIVARVLMLLPVIVLAGIAALWKDFGGFWVWLIRAVLVVILLILLINTTRMAEILQVLQKMGCPRPLILRLNFLYLYLFALTKEAARVKRATRYCGVCRPLSVRKPKICGSILKAFLVCSAERARRMHWGMLTRAYEGDIRVLAARKFSLRDLVFLWSILLFISLTYLMV